MTTPKVKSRKLTKAALTRALRSLGSSSREVAVKLSTLGMKGARTCANRCPVANYLIACFGESASVGVFLERTNVRTVWTTADDYTSVTTPPAVAKFIDSFDKGHYRQLREEPKVADDQTP